MLANSTNSTLVTAAECLIYLPCPIPQATLRILTTILGVLSLLGIIENSVIIHLTKSDTVFLGPDRERQRQALMNFFIYNLAISDLCSCLVSAPSLIIQVYTQRPAFDLQCQVHRGLGFLFPYCAIFQLMAISFERYFTLVNPFNELTVSKSKLLIKGGWVLGPFWATAAALCFKGYKRVLNAHYFTTDCVYEKEDPFKSVLFLLNMVFSFIIPILFISFTTVRSMSLIRKTSSSVSVNDELAHAQQNAAHAQQNAAHAHRKETRSRRTWILIIVIMVFGFSYVPYVIYSVFSLVANNTKFDYTTDSIFRFIVGIFGYSNSIMNPVIYISTMKRLRRKLKGMVTNRKEPQLVLSLTDPSPSREATFQQESLVPTGLPVVEVPTPIELSRWEPRLENIMELNVETLSTFRQENR